MATSRSERTQESHAPGVFEPAASGMFAVNEHRLYWERYGDRNAPCVMLLHHGLGSIRSWRRQIPALIDSGRGVLAYDRWGYGQSDERSRFQHAYLAEDADEAFALLAHLDLEPAALLGHSDGGSIALLMAAERPAWLKALIVVAAHIYFEPLMVEGLEIIARSAADQAFLEALAREHGPRASRLAHAWVEHWRAPGSELLDMRDRLQAIACPTLVIQGALDEHATPQHAMDIAKGVQQGDLWLIPDVRHMPTHEIPGQFNRRVLDFLARVNI